MRYLLAAVALVALVAGFWFVRPSLAPPPPAPLAADAFHVHVRLLGADGSMTSRVHNALSQALGTAGSRVTVDADWSALHTGWGFGGLGRVDGDGTLPEGVEESALLAELTAVLTPLLDHSWDEASVTCDTHEGGATVRRQLRSENGAQSWVPVD